jgi:hypothetical protein
MSRQADRYRGDDYYWSKSHLRQSEAIEELRRNPLADEYKSSMSRREMVSHRDEGSSAKKVRMFFQEELGVEERVKEKLVSVVFG